MQTPILLLVFNRPDTTTRVFGAIRSARPAQLYIAADGPRVSRSGEVERCEEVRRIVTKIDWQCEVKTLFRDRNLGCRRAVSEAITWFFSYEPEGIILEDDILPDASFFPYCEELLRKYRGEPSIMAIQGGNYFGRWSKNMQSSYTFCRVFDPWGWASWARAWERFDDSFYELDKFLSSVEFANMGPNDLDFREHWSKAFKKAQMGENDSWANRWTYSIFQHKGLVAYPKVNLVSNLGFRKDATHTKLKTFQRPPSAAKKRLNAMSFPLRHPEALSVSEELENKLYRERFGVSSRKTLGRFLEHFRVSGRWS